MTPPKPKEGVRHWLPVHRRALDIAGKDGVVSRAIFECQEGRWICVWCGKALEGNVGKTVDAIVEQAMKESKWISWVGI